MIKFLLTATAAMALAGTAGAQTSQTPTNPSTAAPSTTAPSMTTEPTTAVPPAATPDGMGTAAQAPAGDTTRTDSGAGSQTAPGQAGATTGAGTADHAMLTQRGGKWYNGDREATKAEIAAHRQAMKQRPR